MFSKVQRMPVLLLTFLLHRAISSPIPPPKRQAHLDRLRYSQFQISDGYGGDAEVRAAAVFKEPLSGLNLTELPYEIFDHIAVMREATEDANREAFIPEIATASEVTGRKRELQVGQIKNLVLMYTATVQLMEIKLAKDSADEYKTYEHEMDLAHANAHLESLVDTDRQNQGLPSVGVQWPVE